MMYAKQLYGFIGIVGAAILHIFGGIDLAMLILIAFLAADYFSGLAVAIWFKKSKKTKTGGASSKIGFQGLIKKAMVILIVSMGSLVDILLGTDYIKNAMIIGFCANEFVSIVENGGMMGLQYPAIVTNAIDILKQKADEEGKHEN